MPRRNVRVHDVARALDLDAALVVKLSRLGFLPKDERGSYDLDACRVRMAYLRERMVERHIAQSVDQDGEL